MNHQGITTGRATQLFLSSRYIPRPSKVDERARSPKYIPRSLAIAQVKSAQLILLPGHIVAHYAGLPDGSDHEQTLRMFANTAFCPLFGVVAAILAI